MESNNTFADNESISEDSVFKDLIKTVEAEYLIASQRVQYYKKVFQFMLDGKKAGQTHLPEDFENPSIMKGKWMDEYADTVEIKKNDAYHNSDSFSESFHYLIIYSIIADILGNILEKPENFNNNLLIIQSVGNNAETIKDMMIEDFLSKGLEIQEDIYRISPLELEKFREDPSYVPQIPSTDIYAYINHEKFDIVFNRIIKDISDAVPSLGSQ